MPPLRPAWVSLSTVIALLVVITLVAPLRALAAEPSVGVVTRVQNDAEIASVGGAVRASVGSVVRMRDELRTGKGARLQVTFKDNSSLTLGETATVVVDKYVFDPDAGAGEVALNNTAGALRFATGRIKTLSSRNLSVTTPVAALGVRGTDLWTGLVNLVQGVYAIEPVVDVSNQGGAVTLALKGQGTYIASAATAPSPPTFWSAAEVAEALNQTSFGTGEQQQRSRERRGQNQQQQPPPQDQQYAVNGGAGSLIAAVAGATIYAATMSSQENEGRRSRATKPASP
jgi:hypothetical protein